MKNKKLLIFSALLLLSSCSFTTNSSSFNSESSSEEIKESSSLKNENSSTSDSSINSTTSSLTNEGDVIYVNGKNDIDQDAFYEEFYRYTSDIVIDLKFSNKSVYNLAKYSSDYDKMNMYHPVDVTINMNGKKYIFLEAGARMKGNTSRNNNFVNEDGTFNAPIHFKISVNQTFDDEADNDYYIRSYSSDEERNVRKKRRIGAAKKFDIKYNKQKDYSFTKQIYAYNCFESIGIPVQKNNLIKVNVISDTDSYTELYELQECIDSEFIERRYSSESASGDLYKCCWTVTGPANMTLESMNHIGEEIGSYSPTYEIKTNEDTTDHSLLKNLITTLNNDKSDAQTFKPVFDNIFDVDQLLKFEALSWVIGNPDDIRNNANNYYLYFESKTNKAILIPYDYDRCFGILHDWPIDLSNVPYYTTKQNLGENRPWQPNPLFWRTILVAPNGQDIDYAKNYPVITEYRERYIELCSTYAQTFLDLNKYEEFTNQFVHSPKDVNNPGSVNMTFAQYATNKLNSFSL